MNPAPEQKSQPVPSSSKGPSSSHQPHLSAPELSLSHSSFSRDQRGRSISSDEEQSDNDHGNGYKRDRGTGSGGSPSFPINPTPVGRDRTMEYAESEEESESSEMAEDEDTGTDQESDGHPINSSANDEENRQGYAEYRDQDGGSGSDIESDGQFEYPSHPRSVAAHPPLQQPNSLAGSGNNYSTHSSINDRAPSPTSASLRHFAYSSEMNSAQDQSSHECQSRVRTFSMDVNSQSGDGEMMYSLEEDLAATVGFGGVNGRSDMASERQAIGGVMLNDGSEVQKEADKGKGKRSGGRWLLSKEDQAEIARWEIHRVARRKVAIAYLESIPLLILSQLVDCVAIENDRLRKISGLPTSREEDGEDMDQDRDEEDAEPEDTRAREISVDVMDRKTGKPRTIRFPRSAAKSTTPSSIHLARLLRLVEIIHSALIQNITITKRDIYYQDVSLFSRQRIVDELVDDLAANEGMTRSDLNVCASAKGLIAGSGMGLLLKNGKMIDLLADRGSLIPPGDTILRIVCGSEIASDDDAEDDLSSGKPEWILIVEKDAVFQTLCSCSFVDDPYLCSKGKGKGLLITGKGFPDLSTLQLVRLIADQFPSILITALVDADPSGISILTVYRSGSKASLHSTDTAKLALGDRLKWIGVTVSDWSDPELNLDADMLLPLTERDANSAMKMLIDPSWKARFGEDGKERNELQWMLWYRKKAEIQVLSGMIVTRGKADNQRMASIDAAASSSRPLFDDGGTGKNQDEKDQDMEMEVDQNEDQNGCQAAIPALSTSRSLTVHRATDEMAPTSSNEIDIDVSMDIDHDVDDNFNNPPMESATFLSSSPKETDSSLEREIRKWTRSASSKSKEEQEKQKNSQRRQSSQTGNPSEEAMQDDMIIVENRLVVYLRRKMMKLLLEQAERKEVQ